MNFREKSTFPTVVFAALCLNAGCGQTEGPARPKVDEGEKSKPQVASEERKPQVTPATARLHIPFKDAVVFEAPDGENRPPDKTLAGKDLGKIYEQIAGKEGNGLWDSIFFVNFDGKVVRSTARIKTNLGTIELELFPEAAPNHVRNFIALARAGYYDGLPFHRSVRKENADGNVAYLEAGCPLGTGEAGYGSVGYWLKPEISASLHHEEGSIGAYHGEEMDSAASKFYITLGQSPWMDGNYTIFARITQGLDVAHIISKRPVAQDGSQVEPVLIQSVSIIQE